MLAAHMIARVERDGALIDALVLPRSVSEGIPLLMRNTIAPLASQLDPNDPRFSSLQLLLQGDPTAREPAAIAAASFLPKSSILKRALDETRSQRKRQR